MSSSFTSLKEKNKRALMPFITAGYPDKNRCLDFMKCFIDSGADFVEIGIPFSDPLADGPVIQATSYKALQQGVTAEDALDYAEELAILAGRPCGVILTYFNPILAFGLPEFMDEASHADVQAVLVADMIPEESAEFSEAARKAGMPIGFLCSPTCTDARIKLINDATSAFIYLVSVKGVTGVRADHSAEVGSFVRRARKHADKPLYVGFGISSAPQAKAVGAVADGVIVGSAILKMIEEAPTHKRALQMIGLFVKSLRDALDHR